jgi:hypothetical protein
MKIKGNNINQQGTRINDYPSKQHGREHTCLNTSKVTATTENRNSKRYIKTNNLTIRKLNKNFYRRKPKEKSKQIMTKETKKYLTDKKIKAHNIKNNNKRINKLINLKHKLLRYEIKYKQIEEKLNKTFNQIDDIGVTLKFLNKIPEETFLELWSLKEIKQLFEAEEPLYVAVDATEDMQ